MRHRFSFPDPGGEQHRGQSMSTKPAMLDGHVDPALGQEILDVAQRQRHLHGHQHRQRTDRSLASSSTKRNGSLMAAKLPQPARPPEKSDRQCRVEQPADRMLIAVTRGYCLPCRRCHDVLRATAAANHSRTGDSRSHGSRSRDTHRRTPALPREMAPPGKRRRDTRRHEPSRREPPRRHAGREPPPRHARHIAPE